MTSNHYGYLTFQVSIDFAKNQTSNRKAYLNQVFVLSFDYTLLARIWFLLHFQMIHLNQSIRTDLHEPHEAKF